MNILVTGGAGFIGNYLIKLLQKYKNTISIIDNFSNSEKKLISSLENLGIRVFEGDITKFDDILNASKNQDLVIHLAAKISVQESVKNPEKTFQVNVEGTKNVLLACKKNNIKKLIASSSAAVYGEGVKNKKLNEDSVKNPISPYGKSKIKMEEEIIKFCSENKINFVILRFFNIYGIGQTPEYAGVITKFLENIKENKPLKIFGDGTQIRDFVSIYDIIDSIYNAVKYNKNGIFNIGSGKASSINELAETMIRLSGKKLSIEKTSAKEGDIKYSESDISLAKENLEFTPKIVLNEGIKKLLEENR